MMKEIKEVSEMESLILEILMRRFWRTVLPGLRGSRGMMCFSRQERMSTDRRLN